MNVMDAVGPVYDFNLFYAQRLMADLGEEELTAQPLEGVTMNHPAFVIGHLAWANDNGMALVGGTPVLSNLKELWGSGAVPSEERSLYPSKADLIRTLEVSHTRLAAAVKQASKGLLKAPAPEKMRSKFPTHGHILLSLMTSHYAVHLGQLSAWRRAMGLPSVF
jgi:hypothetical protein